MLDLKLIRQDPERVRAGARKKRIPCDIDRILELDREARELGQVVDARRSEQKQAGKSMQNAKPDERALLLEAQKQLKADLVRDVQVLLGGIAATDDRDDDRSMVHRRSNDTIQQSRGQRLPKIVYRWNLVQNLIIRPCSTV